MDICLPSIPLIAPTGCHQSWGPSKSTDAQFGFPRLRCGMHWKCEIELRLEVSRKVKLKATCGQFLVPVIFTTLGSASRPRKSGDTQIAHRSEYAVERRKGIRYRMSASVMFRWSGPEDGQYQGEGITRDISVAGVFVMTATCPPPNAVLQMEVLLPLSDGTSKALMKADMMILRVEHNVEGNKRSGDRKSVV